MLVIIGRYLQFYSLVFYFQYFLGQRTIMFSISKSICTRIALGSLLVIGFSSTYSYSVKAESFSYEDRDENFTISFPDTWKRVNNQKTDDEITIAAPGVNDYATCRVRVRKDRRYVIYPGKFDSDIQKVAYSRDFWNKYLGDYNDIVVDIFKDYSGLGRGYASMAEASYETAETVPVRKRGVMFATLYHDRVYIVDCSSEESVYYKWRPSFMSIVKSFEITSGVRHSKVHGYYRAFDNDKKVKVLGRDKLDTYSF